MAKKSRLHEFEKNNRVINIPQAQDARRERLEIARQKKREREKRRSGSITCGWRSSRSFW